MASIRLLNSETLSEKKYLLQYITFESTYTTGQLQQHQREVYIRPQGASLLLYNPQQKKVLLCRQFRLPAWLLDHSGDVIETCAGIIDDGETAEEAVIREAEEELGYRVASVKKIGEVYPTPGAVSELIHLYIGEYSDNMKVHSGGGKADEGEDIEVLELSFNQVRNMLEKQQFTDAKTIILIQHAIINGLI